MRIKTKKPFIADGRANRAESNLCTHRFGMFMVLTGVLIFGTIIVTNVFWPDAEVSKVLAQSAWGFAVPPVLMIFINQWGRRRNGISPETPEYKALMHDEWRRASMARASRGTLIVVLAAQVPLALLLVHMPTVRAVWGMVGLNITLELGSLVGLYLYFDRDHAMEDEESVQHPEIQEQGATK
jgi:hypothetical protein